MTSQDDYSKRVVSTIIDQLGGKRFMMMTGCKNFIYQGITEDNNNVWVRMDVPRNSGNINRFKVTYNRGTDSYELEFYQQRFNRKTFEYEVKNKKEFFDVYAEQLQTFFTGVTGLYTSL